MQNKYMIVYCTSNRKKPSKTQLNRVIICMKHIVQICLVFCFSIIICSAMVGQGQLEIAKKYLISHHKNIRLTTDELVISSIHTSAQSGVTHVYFNQSFNGINIYNAISNVAIARSGKIIYANDRFVSHRSFDSEKEHISAIQAASKAAKHFNLPIQHQSRILSSGSGLNKKTTLQNESISKEDIKTELMYVHKNGKLILSWSVIFENLGDQFWWDVKVNASNGKIIEKTTWTLECNFTSETICGHTEHMHYVRSTYHKNDTQFLSSLPANANIGDYQVLAMPNESPNHGPISIVNSPWLDNISSTAHPYNWHHDGTTPYFTTRGNNVWAVEDRDANNIQDLGYSPMSQLANSNEHQYNFTADFNVSPEDYQAAAITNLFYWNNIMHDVTYHYGFDEAAGNFQVTNNTGNGIGGDPIYADAQDGYSRNNARINVLPDGNISRMEMFEWVSPDTALLAVTSPINANYEAFPPTFGPFDNFSGTVVLVNDTNGGTNGACSFNPILNGSELNGKIALIDGGNCSYTEKIINAENEGAIGVILCYHNPNPPFNFSGSAPFPGIAAVMMSQADCATLRSNLPATISVDNYSSVPNRASDFDNAVIAHEYAHGISSRLTGGAANVGCLTGQDQMGEGWSDFFGLIMTMNPGDTGSEMRGVGTYLKFESTTGTGTRPFAYSTDMTVSPVTYADTANPAFSIPHGVGSIWATMLWDMTWRFINLYGMGTNIYNASIADVGTVTSPGPFGGQNLALQLVVEGMKLQPCNPGFIDGRDAILAADQILYGGIHQCIIWEVFAARGLGASAEQGDVAIVADNVEAFDMPNLNIQKTTNSIFVTDHTSVSYDLLVTGACETHSSISIIDNLDPSLTLETVVCPSPATYTTSDNTLVITHPGLSFGQQFSCTVTLIANTGYAESAQNLLFEDVESLTQMTESVLIGSELQKWKISNTDSYSTPNSWFVPNFGGDEVFCTLESPTLQFGPFPIIRFFHRFNTEKGFDGGYIEVTTDSGTNWQIVNPSAFLLNGYNNTLAEFGNNQFSMLPAWTGNSYGFVETIADLSDFAHSNAKVRFSYRQNDSGTAQGWWVDDISIDNGFPRIMNTACIRSDQLIDPACDNADILVELRSCLSPDTDSDGDGVCDNFDVCPWLDDWLIGTACEDGDVCTVGETYDANCNCTNGVYQDVDNDGICDAYDTECSTVYFEGFESNTGLWIPGGEDAERLMSVNSPFENYSMRIRDNSGEASSFSTIPLDFTIINDLQIYFSFRAISMESGKSFLLELSNDNGLSFSIIREWVSDTDFENAAVQLGSALIAQSQLSTNSILRFRCNGFDDSDEVYIDNILFDSCTPCPDQITDYSNAIASSSLQAGISITNNGIIQTNSNIEFYAGQFVELAEGFEVKPQAVFHALIEGCSN